MRIRPKQLQQLLRQAEEQGCLVEHTKNGHIRITTPKGPVFAASTGSDPRGWKNLRALLRQKGLKI